ncbi:hypothetical protein MJM28_27510, partial [Salmonella enterica subsp. enterica serovar Montevideo]|nr:hypothetical protein [Salmonella enterica subsp. enterica serovar Montevideo]
TSGLLLVKLLQGATLQQALEHVTAAVYEIMIATKTMQEYELHGSGILRGYKDTRSIFFITFTAYWVLGLPSGYILALTDLVVDR